MTIDPNGPAFPETTGIESKYEGERLSGLTVRAYIATHCLAGNLANNKSAGTLEQYSQDAIQQADSLIAELNKENSK